MSANLDTTARILRSFWHRTRRDFVPWTGAEIDRRANTSLDDRKIAVSAGLISASNDGLVYEITEKGKSIMGEMK